MKRLSLKDYLGLRHVCSTWRATVSNAIASKHCHPLPELPMIFLSSNVSTICSLTTEQELGQKSLVLNSSRRCLCHGTVEGWLILSERIRKDSLAIRFFNPVTHATILVPHVLKFPFSNLDDIPKYFYLGKMVASSDPNSSPKSDCFLAGVFTDRCHIAFCKLSDMSWTIIEAEEPDYYKDIEIIGSKLYVIAITKEKKTVNSVLVYDLLQDSSKPSKRRVLEFPPNSGTIISEPAGNIITMCGDVDLFLAKDDASGELFLVSMSCNITYDLQHLNGRILPHVIPLHHVIPPNITSIEVFTLDTKNETTQEWKKVNDLGDKVLFVGFCKSIVMSRAVLNNNKEVIARNSIYFAFRYICPSDPWGAFQVGKICLTDNNSHRFSLGKSCHQKVPYPYWFLPNV